MRQIGSTFGLGLSALSRGEAFTGRLTLAPRCGTTLLSEGGMFAADRQALWGAIGVGVLFVVAGGLLGGLPGLVVVAIVVGAVGWGVTR